MAKQRYFRVLQKAGAFIDDFHYAQDEIVPYNPSEAEDKAGKPLWGQETDEHGNDIGEKKNPDSIRDSSAESYARAHETKPTANTGTGSADGTQTHAGDAGKNDGNTLTDEQKKMVVTALDLLEAGNDQHWTQAGNPKAEAVTAILGFTVTHKDLKAIAPDLKRPAKA